MSAIVRIKAEIIIKGVEIQPMGRKKWGTYCMGLKIRVCYPGLIVISWRVKNPLLWHSF